MIKFHYHTSPKAVPRLGIQAGDELCHVYSDESVAELLRWAGECGLRPEWIHRHRALPHFDLFGERLARCGRGVSRRELAGDIRAWRSQYEARSAMAAATSPTCGRIASSSRGA
ncbi:MAG: DUF4031 domain-containing protein [Gemmatimonadota bacterium]